MQGKASVPVKVGYPSNHWVVLRGRDGGQVLGGECWRMLAYADWRALTYADWRVLTYADVCWRMLSDVAGRGGGRENCCCAVKGMLTYADVCWLTYADVCWLTYADVCWRRSGALVLKVGYGAAKLDGDLEFEKGQPPLPAPSFRAWGEKDRERERLSEAS